MPIIALYFSFRPQPVVVDKVEVNSGDLAITVDEEGRTRVHDIYALPAAVDGRLRCIDLHAGDPVTALDSVIAEIEPADPSFLDPCSEAQAQATPLADVSQVLFRVVGARPHVQNRSQTHIELCHLFHDGR